jgi:putative membrane protein
MMEKILICLVALLHFYFLILEMFFWTRPTGLRIFRNTLQKARDSAVLAANQGLYNGFLASGLVWSLIESDPLLAHKLKIYFLACVIIAGLYGAYSVNRRAFYFQALPAVLALIFVLI